MKTRDWLWITALVFLVLGSNHYARRDHYQLSQYAEHLLLFSPASGYVFLFDLKGREWRAIRPPSEGVTVIDPEK